MNNEYLEFAKEIAYQAGKIMLKYDKQDNGALYKKDQTIVTLADTEINEYLIQRVKEKYPNHSVNGEEDSFGDSNYVWVCDPVDGTAMYARHIPVAVFSLALVIDGISEIGIVYDPFRDELYYAIKGQGAYRNDKEINVNKYILNQKESIVNFDMWPEADYQLQEILTILSRKTYLLSIGSVIRACMTVASGDFVAAIFPGTKKKNCDIAAVKVIVEEAGGRVTNLFGEEQYYDKDIKGALISNGIVHEEIVNIIKEKIK